MASSNATKVEPANPNTTLAPAAMPDGLTSAEATSSLRRDGPNAMPDTSAHRLRNALTKFWAPVPWLLEASIVLQIVLHKYFEAAVIGGLLVFNAALAYFRLGLRQTCPLPW